jgi:uncharacterized protein YegL
MKNITQSVGFVALALILMTPVASAESIKAKLDKEYKQQTGTAITIIFDDSGSMSGKKITQAKAAFKSWLETAPNHYRFSLIHFANNGRLAIPLGENTRRAVASKVASFSARYGTPICAALAIAQNQIRKRRAKVSPYERHVVLLFTDGKESGRRGNRGVQEDIRMLRNESVEVVGIGFHGQGDYMDGVATRFFSATDQEQLHKGLSAVDAEIGDISDIKVTDADLLVMKTVVPVSMPAPGTETTNPAKTSRTTKKKGSALFGLICCFGFPLILLLGGIALVVKLTKKSK